jgi:hypothetical protein
VAVTAAVVVVAAALGVAVGGALLAGLGLTACVIAGVVGLALWRRHHHLAAVAVAALAAASAVAAVAGFVDALS